MNHVLPKGNDAKVIFCTSTIKGEGKTFISLNLSLAMASLNKKVLLIGADLRNPQIHTYAKVDKNSLGVSNYLSYNKVITLKSQIKCFIVRKIIHAPRKMGGW